MNESHFSVKKHALFETLRESMLETPYLLTKKEVWSTSTLVFEENDSYVWKGKKPDQHSKQRLYEEFKIKHWKESTDFY